ncbi:glycosyltransferase family 4 protein [Caldimonas caldifontis]|uniref:Colanic acid biosynthesis glycosyltransferase WcaL n=1 Tax=Caldimonas caldifontis TaxID=1452508 RepID=A0A2S5SQB6_9BURK|nr:glycosyltransferase family 4 protein [Caldimonas caldifontis]PPE64922.1 colanic acid biosynthesis glycosyltransferase WcaL [Caldimonas caldifontis]
MSEHSSSRAVDGQATRVAYLVNQYPKVSHSFIRREILAVERQGIAIERFALRGWDEPVVDPQDVSERAKTRYVLQGGLIALLAATAHAALTAPGRFARALWLATRLGLRSDRPLPVHWIYLAEACVLARWLRQAQVSHLHAHFGTNPAEVAMLAGVLSGLPYSFTAHGSEETDKPQFIGLPEKIRRAAFVVAVSSYGRAQLYRWSRLEDWPKIHVVHCGLERGFYEAVTVQPVEASRLVCVGRLCQEKGQLLLLRALRYLRDEGLDCELVLAGDGEMRAAIEHEVDRLGLRGQVCITGWISSERVREEILAARALVLPSFAEGLPVVLMEAMALGRPVISTYVAGIPELVVEDECGWLSPAGDLERLVESIKECLRASPRRLEAMGAIARERAVLRHDIDTEAARLTVHFRASGRVQQVSS